MNITNDVVHVELFRWMQRITAANDGKHYLMIGQVRGMKDTLLVTLEHGNGGAVMFCQKHNHVYQIKGRCAECQNAVLEVDAEASVTVCDTP